MPGVSENFSDNQPTPEGAKKRGRPRKLDPLARTLAQFVEGDPCSERLLQNTAHFMRSVHVLKGQPRFAWLMGPDGRQPTRKTLLAELGRIEDDDQLLAVALQLCDLKPKVADGVALVRQFRLGRQPAGTAAGLQDALRLSLNAYLAGHTGLSTGEVLEALDGLRGLVAEQFGDDEDEDEAET